MNSLPPSTWIPRTGKRGLGDQFVEQRLGAGGAGSSGDAADGPFGDRVIGGEVFDRRVGPHVDEERVDLNELAGAPGLAAFGQAAGVTL
jgi:hypothetical protein